MELVGRGSSRNQALSGGRVRANPFEGLLPALEVIAQQANVLPATGQALEDLMRPDHEEVVDRLRNIDDRVMEVLLEKPNRQSYVQVQPLHRTKKHLLRFFLDGSARTFFLGGATGTYLLAPVTGSHCVPVVRELAGALSEHAAADNPIPPWSAARTGSRSRAPCLCRAAPPPRSR